MARTVAWTELAWDDLERTVDYIAHDSPAYGASFARKIWELAQSLEDLPERGRTVPELGDPNVRELLPSSYRLLYEIREDTIFILGVIHGARDLAGLWDREGDKRREDQSLSTPH
jgi:plasmid stabilization system protein ParE